MDIFISYLSWWLSQTVESWTEKAVDSHEFDRLQLKFSVLSMLQVFSHPYEWPHVVLFLAYCQRTLNGLIDLAFQRIIDFSWCSQTLSSLLVKDSELGLARTIVHESSIQLRAQLDVVVNCHSTEKQMFSIDSHPYVWYLSLNPRHPIRIYISGVTY